MSRLIALAASLAVGPPCAVVAQAPPNQLPKPTPAIQTMLDAAGNIASSLGESIRKEAEDRVRQTGDELPALLDQVNREKGEKIGAVYALASPDELDFLIATFAGRAHLSLP